VPFFLVSFLDPDTKSPLSVDPRGVLKLATERAESAGYRCFSGVEYEVCLDIIYYFFFDSISNLSSTSTSKVKLGTLHGFTD